MRLCAVKESGYDRLGITGYSLINLLAIIVLMKTYMDIPAVDVWA